MGSSIVKDLPELVENNIISAETATAIERYYAGHKQGGNQFMIYGSLGGVLVGLGIILIFAHNWDDFSRTAKTLLALFPLVLFQGFTLFTIVTQKARIWKEISSTLLFFSVGAALSLISQIYNMPGEESSFILTWVLLCTPLMYIVRSDMPALLHLVFSTIYAVTAGYFEPASPWMYLVLTAAFLPFYIQQLKQGKRSYSVSVFNSLVPLSLTIALGAFI